MSTKTSIKRIAAVAAVALTVGGFSAVSAHAGTTPTIAATSGTNATTGNGTATATASATVGNYVVDTITAGTLDSVYTITSTGVGSLALAAAPSAATQSTAGAITTADTNYQNYSVNSATSVTWYAGTFPGGHVFATGGLTIAATSAVAGTQTITVTGNAGGSATETITWGAAPVVTAQYSTVYIKKGLVTSAPTASDTGVAFDKAAVTASASAAASIFVQLNSAASTAITGQGLSVSVSGPGTLAVEANTAASDSNFVTTAQNSAGRALSVTAASTVGSKFYINVFGDGTTGVSTVTVTSGTVTVGTVSLTFTGSAAKVSATQNLKVLKAGGVAGTGGTAGQVYSGAGDAADATSILTTSAPNVVASGTTSANMVSGLAPITVHTTDANGNPVQITATDATKIKVVSSDTTVLTAGTCVNATGYSIDAAGSINEINCYVLGATGAASGATATATVELYNSTTAAWDILAAPLTFKIGGAITAETLSTDASSYSPGSPVALTVTATDKAGNAAYDEDGPFVVSLASSTYMNGLAAGAALIGGVAKKSTGIYAPLVEGDFTISALDAVSAAGEALSVTASVAGGASTAAQAAVDAANEATDAANAATDAANNAMDSADAAQQAALDAGDKADAALAAVTDLATKVSAIASQIESLSALVKKIAAKVKA